MFTVLGVVVAILSFVGAVLLVWALLLFLVVGHRWLALNPAPKARVIEYDAEGNIIRP